jgi:hypothetical protein
MKKLSTFLSNRRGQSLVETSIMLPILLIILVGIVELGFALANQMSVTTSAREGARYGARFGPTNEPEVNDAILDVVHETPSEIFSLDETRADVYVARAKTDETGHIDSSSTSFSAPSYWVFEPLQDIASVPGTLVTPAQIEEDLDYAPDMAVIVVQVFYDHRSVLGLPIVAQLSDQIPIGTYTVMRIEPSQKLSPCCLYPLAIKGETLLGPPARKEGDTFDGWIKDDIQIGNFGWMRWDPASSSGNANALVDRLQNPCLATRDYANPRDTGDTSLNAGDLVMGDSGAVNANAVRAEMDKLCGADTDSDYQSNHGNDYCQGDVGYDGDGAWSIRIPVYDTIVDSGSNFKYQVYDFAIIQILDYYIPAGQEVRLTTRFVSWDHKACKVGE